MEKDEYENIFQAENLHFFESIKTGTTCYNKIKVIFINIINPF